jgi:hypothetical protein
MISPALVIGGEAYQWYVHRPDKQGYIGIIDRIGNKFRPVVCVGSDYWLRAVNSLEAAEAAILIAVALEEENLTCIMQSPPTSTTQPG